MNLTEKIKMLNGKPYDASDPELTNERIFAKNTLLLYNQTTPTQSAKRIELLTQLLKCESDCYIEPPFFCDYGYNIKLGKNFYANHNCVILDVNVVTIGDHTMFGPAVQIYTATHPVDPMLRLSGLEMGYPITIGNNVWIGGNSVVCPGVSIGDNVTIGAGSVVTKDIPDNVVAAGNPCTLIREL